MEPELTEEERLAVLKAAVFGKQVEEFMSSEIGKYLLERSDNEYLDGVEKLKVCEAHELFQVQNEVKRAESFRLWLEEAVLQGMQALNIMEDRE